MFSGSVPIFVPPSLWVSRPKYKVGDFIVFYDLNYRDVLGIWGPFLESPGNFSGPKSNIQIEM